MLPIGRVDSTASSTCGRMRFAAPDARKRPEPRSRHVSRKLALDIYRLAWPVLIAQLAVMAYAVIDTIMAGRFATDDLAAVGIGASIYFSVFVALMGVLLAVSPIVGQLLGAGRLAEIGEQVRQGMWLTLAMAVLSVVVFRFPEPFLALSEPVAGGRREGARVSCDRRVGRARGARVSPVRELHDRGVAAARDDGAEPLRPAAQGAARMDLRVRASGLAGHGSVRMRAVDRARQLGHRHPGVGVLRAVAGVPQPRRFRALVVAAPSRPAPHPRPRHSHRRDVPGGRDRIHVHGAVHRPSGRGQFRRAPDRLQRRGRDVHAPARHGQWRRRTGGASHRGPQARDRALDRRHGNRAGAHARRPVRDHADRGRCRSLGVLYHR